MTKINEYETETQRFNRQRNESIVNEYIERSHDILLGNVTPHRLCEFLAERYNMSRYGITLVLKRAGVYKSAKQPIVIEHDNVKQGTLPFTSSSSQSITQ